MRKSVWILALSFIMATQGIGLAASTVDSLVQKLVEKGILTDKEATQLKGEIAYNEKAQIEEGSKKQVPDWVQNMKIGGDMRARLQTEHNEAASNGRQGERVRARMRARVNFETKVNDKAKVVIGIASDGGTFNDGKNNARSNNYTYGSYTSSSTLNPFSKPFVVLNKAYGQYMVNDRLTLTAGKMDSPVWEPMEFLLDSDITPEGASARYDYKVNSMVSLSAIGSAFSLGEFNPSTSDPLMYVGQLIVTVKPTEKIDAKLAFTYVGYGNIKSGFNGGHANNSTGNTAIDGANALKYDYSAPMGSIDIGMNDPFGEMLPAPIYIPRIGIFGEYTANPGAPDKNVAWMAGAYLGNSKVNGWGTWKATAAYKTLAKDAWLDVFPDSDFYGGNTGVAGTEGILEIGLAKNLSMGIDYYKTRRIGSTVAKAPEHVVQYDILWKF